MRGDDVLWLILAACALVAISFAIGHRVGYRRGVASVYRRWVDMLLSSIARELFGRDA